MAHDVSGLIFILSTKLPKLTFELSPQFASNAPDFRSRLRAHLHNRLQQPQLLDLSQIPRLDHGFVSISHCPSLGGYVLSKDPIGFDIEETSRVEQRFVDRMSHPNDHSGPSPAALWCAKESAFKALADQQPSVIAQISVNNWKTVDQNFFSFKSSAGDGFILEHFPWTLAVSF
jgi:phosphopantetheinyl transferase (holo-ACP synthase)